MATIAGKKGPAEAGPLVNTGSRRSQSAIPGRVTGRGSVSPVNLGHADKGAAARDPLIFTGTAGILEGAWATGRGARIGPTQIGLVTVAIADDAITRGNALVDVEVGIKIGGAFHARPVEKTTFALVVEDGATKLAHPEKVVSDVSAKRASFVTRCFSSTNFPAHRSPARTTRSMLASVLKIPSNVFVTSSPPMAAQNVVEKLPSVTSPLNG